MQRRVGALAIIGTGAMALATTTLGLGTAAAAPAQSCDRSPQTTICVTAEDPAYPASSVRVDLFGQLAETTMAGDQVVVGVPSKLHFPVGATYEILTAEGTAMGTMVVGATDIVITWNTWIETHPLNASWQAFLSAQVTGDVEKGANSLTWNVDGTVLKTSINGAICENDCTAMPQQAGKWATQLDSRTIDAGLVSPTLNTGGTLVRWEDTVGAGQEIDCDSVSGAWYSTKDPRTGWLKVGGWITPTITSCDKNHVAATFSDTEAGKVYGLTLRIRITDPSLDSWSDYGSVTVDDGTHHVEARATRYAGGGAGTGTSATPTPQLTVSPSGTPSTDPSPAPQVSGAATGNATIPAAAEPTSADHHNAAAPIVATATPVAVLGGASTRPTAQGATSRSRAHASTRNIAVNAASSAPQATTSLAHTGTEPLPLVIAGGSLVGIGSTILLVPNLRRSPHTRRRH